MILCQNCMTVTDVIKRLREFVDLETLLIAYKTLVQPYFEYCSQVWGGLGSTLSDKLQRLQNRAVSLSVDTMSVPIFFYKI